MIAVDFLVVALALFITLLLCGFVGCAEIAGLQEPDPAQPDYAGMIKKTPGLVAYWRLGEKASTPIPGKAKSEVGGLHGVYKELNPVTVADTQQHSPETSGVLILGDTPGLLTRSPQSSCMNVDGGFVEVPFNLNLNRPQFTLELWVSPDPTIEKGFFRCLAQSAGPPGLGVTKKTGWGLYLGPRDRNKTPPDDYFWQVWMGNGNEFKRILIAERPANPTKLRLTYLVLTFDGIKNLRLWLYYPGTKQELDIVHLMADEVDVTTPFRLGSPFKPNDSSDEGNGVLLIGAGSPLFPVTTLQTQHLYPFKGRIQEVALYDRDLMGPPPKFEGLTAIFGPHHAEGGDF
jgi:hypothetical protein